MHQGCFVRTWSPPPAGRRTPRPGPVRVCVCSSVLAGSGRPAARARFGAPHLVLWLLFLSACSAPSGLGLLPLWFFGCLPPPPSLFLPAVPFSARLTCLFLSLVSSPGCLGPWRLVFLSSSPPRLVFCFFFHRAPPLSPAFSGFRPRVPWTLALCALCFLCLPLLGSPCALASFVVPAWPFAAPWWFLRPPPPSFVSRCFSLCCFVLCFFFFFFSSLRAPVVSGFLWFPAPLLGSPCALTSLVVPAWPLASPWWLLPPPPFFCVSLFFSRCRFLLRFFFSLRAPVVSGFLWFPAPGALGLGAVCCLFCWPPAPCALASFVVPAWPLAATGGCCPPPLSFVSPCFSRCRFVLRWFFPSRCAPPLSLAFSGFRPRVPWALALCAVCSVGLLLLGSLCALASFVVTAWLLAAPWWLSPPPLFCVWLFFSLPLCAPFFFLSRCAPPLSLAFSGFRPRVPWALALWAVCSVDLPLLDSSCALASFVVTAWPLAAPWWLLRPPHRPFLSGGFRRCCSVLCSFFLLVGGSHRLLPPCPGACMVPCAVWCCRAALPFRVVCCAVVPRLAVLWAAARCAVFVGVFVSVLCCAAGCCCLLCRAFSRAVRLGCSRCCLLPGFGLCCRVPCCAVCPWVRCCAALLRVVPPGVVLFCAVLFCCVCLVSLLVVSCPLALPVALGPCALRRCVLRCSPALCALCCGVLSWRAGARCCSPLCCVLCVSWGVALCVPCPLRSVRCCVLLCWCACVVLFVWCVLLLAPGAVVRCCMVLLPLVFCSAVLGLAARGCLLAVCFGVGVPVWPRGLVPCGWCGLLWCPASLCRVLWCCAVSWCCAALFCCRFAMLFVLALPSCGLSCRAVLCCWLSVLFCARWWCLCAVVPCPSLPARTKTLIVTLCYPAPVSASLSHLSEGSGLAARRFVADPRGCL